MKRFLRGSSSRSSKEKAQKPKYNLPRTAEVRSCEWPSDDFLRAAGIYDDFYELAENAGLVDFLHDQREQHVQRDGGGPGGAVGPVEEVHGPLGGVGRVSLAHLNSLPWPRRRRKCPRRRIARPPAAGPPGPAGAGTDSKPGMPHSAHRWQCRSQPKAPQHHAD